MLLRELIVRFTSDTKDLEAGMSRAASSMQQAGAAMTASLTAPIAAIAAVGLEFNAMRERAEIAFTGILGSGSQARAFLDDLARFAAATPFEFPELVKAAQRFTALGFEAKAVIPIMTALGDAVAAFGGTSEDINRVSVQLSQMIGKGKVNMQDLRVIAESIPGAMQVMADKLGISMSKMFAQMEKGSISAATGVEAMLTGLAEKYNGQMEKQSRTFSGLMSTLKDTARFAAADITKNLFDVLKNGLTALVDLLPKLVKAFGALPDQIKMVGLAIAGVLAVLGPVTLAIGAFIALLGGPLTVAIIAVGGALVLLAGAFALSFDRMLQSGGIWQHGMSLNMIQVAMAVGSVADAFAILATLVGADFDIILTAAAIFVRSLARTFAAIGEMVSAVGQTLKSVFTGDMTGAMEGVKQMGAVVGKNLQFAADQVGQLAGTGGLFQRLKQDAAAVSEHMEGKFAKSFVIAAAEGQKATGTWKRSLEETLKEIKEAFDKLKKGAGDVAKDGGKAGAEMKKVLAEHAAAIESFLEATGQKIKVTGERLKDLPATLSGPLLKVALLFKGMKEGLEDINFERAVRGLPQLSDEFKILGKTISAEFATIKALPPEVIKAFEKLGFKFKEIFPGMTQVVIDLSAALKESVKNAEMLAVGEAAMAKFADVTEREMEKADKALVTFGDQLRKLSADIDFWVDQSKDAFDAGRANIVESVMRQGEDIAKSLGKTGGDIQKFGEQWAKGILENLVRAGKLTQEELDKLVEIHRKEAIKLPGIWESVLQKVSSRTKGMLSDVFGVIDTMPGKWGDAIRKTKSEIENWVSFIDSAVKLIQRLLGDQSPSGLGGILSGLSGMFAKTGSAIKAGFGSDIAKALGMGGKAAGGGAMGGLAGFMAGPWGAAIGIGTSLLGPLLGGLFKSGHQKRMEKMAEEEKRLQIDGLKEDIKKAMQETVQAAIQTMQDALKLFDEMPGFAAIPKGIFKSFFANLTQVLEMFADMAGKFNSDLLAKVKAFSEAIGPAIQLIADGVGAFDQLAGFVGVSHLSIQDFGVALEGVLNELATVREGMEKRIIKLSRALAEKVMEAIDVIKSGVEAFTGLMEFKEVPKEAMVAFGASLEMALETFMEISARLDFFLLKQAAKMAERMNSIVSTIGAGVEALKGILDFQSVPTQVLQSFAANLEEAINIFIAVSGRIDAELVQRSATIADRMSSILESLKGIPEVFGLIRDYKAVGSNAISAIMQDFDAVASMVEYLLDRAMRLKGNAEAFAQAVADIRGSLASVFGSSFLGGGGGTGGGGGAYMPGASHGSIDPYFTRSPLDTSPDPGTRTPHGSFSEESSGSTVIQIENLNLGGLNPMTQAAQTFAERLVSGLPGLAFANRA